MLRFGTITEVKPEKGLARVQFAEDEITSAWLPIVQDNTLGDKNYRGMKVDEHVACLMDEHAENGVIVGAIYNKKDTPAYSGEKVGVKFEDGTEVVYDKSTSTYTIKSQGKVVVDTQDNVEIVTTANVTITCGKLIVDGTIEASGSIKTDGSIEANGDITAASGSIPISLITHKHSGVTPGPSITGPSVP
jgi:phage baseplate assembly protein V